VAEEVRGALVDRFGSGAVEAFLAAGKGEVGSPWGREPQEAALAAWGSLQEGSRS
jgi:hypothetical protein